MTSSSYSAVEKSCNILLIGLSYNRHLINQLLSDPNINHITQCVDVNGRSIDQCVARDTFRCFVLENMYPHLNIFTVNRCTDLVRSVDDDSNANTINVMLVLINL